MTNQEQAHPPADGGRPGGEEVPHPSPASGSDVPVGMGFDYIDEAIEESMDASDPPALTPQTTIGPPGRDASRGPDKGHRD